MVWMDQYHGQTFHARDDLYGGVSTCPINSGEADDTVFLTMPAASPLLNHFPGSAVSDSVECPFRCYNPPSTISLPDPPPLPTLPPSSSSSAPLVLPADYDPFKFLSAMTEQCLMGNFPPPVEHAQTLPAQSSASGAASSSHFLFGHHPHQSPYPVVGAALTSFPRMTSSSSPHTFYASSSSGCYVYGEGGGRGEQRGGEEYGCLVPKVEVVDSYQPQQQQQQQQYQQYGMTSPCATVVGGGGGGGGRGGGEVGVVPSASRKSFFCFTDELMETADTDGLLSWTRHHPEHWTHGQVLDWLFYVAQERGLDMRLLKGEAFQSLTGRQLTLMTRDDFARLEPQYGAVLFHMFKTLLCGVTFSQPPSKGPEQGEVTSQTHCPELSPYSAVSCDSPRDSPAPAPAPPPTYHTFPTPPKHCPDMAPPAEMFWKQERTEWKVEQNELAQQPGVLDIESYDFDLSDPPHLPQPRVPVDPCGAEHDLFSTSYPATTAIRTSCFFPPYHPYPPPLPRRRPGRPRVKSLPEDDGRVKDKKAKNQHLWEFIYEVLLNPLYNPQYLRWENQREGVFRFVQSEAVAQLWGSRKNNENMTYEKLSRAMRHYYKRGILERVEGRRLVYKFSRKAMDKVHDKRHNSV